MAGNLPNTMPEEYHPIALLDDKCYKILTNVITKLDNLEKAKKPIYPKIENIFRAFRLCPLNNIKVIILGQDPYPGVDNKTEEPIADGLCFSCVRKRPSAHLIIKCLQHNNLIREKDFTNIKSFNLERWATQGIFLINRYLTHDGTPLSHKELWNDYVSIVIDNIYKYYADKKMPPPLIMLWGNEAQSINKTNIPPECILTWGHPSPVSGYNRVQDNPKNFIFNDNFKTANEILKKRGQTEIDWNFE